MFLVPSELGYKKKIIKEISDLTKMRNVQKQWISMSVLLGRSRLRLISILLMEQRMFRLYQSVLYLSNSQLFQF